jgi:signal transduction histidine kinase/AmiR/NasT family two-component response regulator
MGAVPNRRILIVDDQQSIHDDFRKILGAGDAAKASSARSAFLGAAQTATSSGPGFRLSFADQGERGVQLLEEAFQRGERQAMAFVDVRMPPGLDGLQTIQGLWRVDPALEVVICTAYSDYSFEEIVAKLGSSHRLLILKKPFDPVEVRQLADALTEKWNVSRREEERLADLARAEAEARERADELARVNVALEEANVRAEAASRAKSEFLANMSHEIRTPMNALLGHVDLLCDSGATEDERRGYSETIHRSGEHLLTILNDILDISRIEAGRLVVKPTDFSPLELAREVVSMMWTQAAEKDLKLRFEADGALPRVVRSDPVRVRQILLNLLGNAIKFTKRGQVSLAMKLEPGVDDTRRTLRFEVADTGIGIEAKDRARLFQAFSQADGSSTRQAGGAGLGLAISKRLAGILGGDITVESEPGRGSVFTFLLEVDVSGPGALVRSDSEEESRAAAASAKTEDPLGALPGRVLVVEDVRFNQVLLTSILHKAGADVSVADDGKAGFDAVVAAEAEGRPFALVLMDMQMPVMDGYEAARRLREWGYEGPIVALTAHAMTGDREKCLEAGCNEYTTKPIDRRALLAACRRTMSLEGTRAPLPRRDRESGSPRRRDEPG